MAFDAAALHSLQKRTRCTTYSGPDVRAVSPNEKLATQSSFVSSSALLSMWRCSTRSTWPPNQPPTRPAIDEPSHRPPLNQKPSRQATQQPIHPATRLGHRSPPLAVFALPFFALLFLAFLCCASLCFDIVCACVGQSTGPTRSSRPQVPAHHLATGLDHRSRPQVLVIALGRRARTQVLAADPSQRSRATRWRLVRWR